MNIETLTKSISSKDIAEKWHIVDAKDIILGNLASRVARILRGKHRTDFTPHMNHADKVIVINAAEVRVTGKKMQNKLYHHHTGYVGHLRTTNLKTMMEKHPIRAVEYAIKGMLPHNKLGRALYRNLFVYPGAEHKHEAQKPVKIENEKR